MRNKYRASVAYAPEMKTMELRTAASAATATLSPATGKKLRVFGFYTSQFVDGTVATTVRSTLAFGTDHTGTASKIIAGYRQQDEYDDAGHHVNHINLIGDVNEVVRLTNVTYTGAGSISTRTSVYYIEE